MRVPIYQVDAFSSALFGGNPAAVCVLDEPLDGGLMQSIAMENNLSETAYIWPQGGDDELWHIRWYTPTCEIDLCGHATLASAHVLFHHMGIDAKVVRFQSRRYGVLTVTTDGDWMTLDFPADDPQPVAGLDGLEAALGASVVELRKGRNDYLALLESESVLRGLDPDMAGLAAVECRAVMVTAAGDGGGVDFVSRFFAPRMGIPEDPVTGAAHTTLTPFWVARLGASTLLAHQLSARGGELKVELLADRVLISGQAVTYLTGQIGRLV